MRTFCLKSSRRQLTRGCQALPIVTVTPSPERGTKGISRFVRRTVETTVSARAPSKQPQYTRSCFRGRPFTCTGAVRDGIVVLDPRHDRRHKSGGMQCLLAHVSDASAKAILQLRQKSCGQLFKARRIGMELVRPVLLRQSPLSRDHDELAAGELDQRFLKPI
jgi:hypothetical protein